MKSRIVILFIGICCLWALLVIRASSLQIIPNDRLEALRQKQFRTVVTLQARRGAITDREGRDLALSATAFSVYADPKLLENRRAVAKKIAKELGRSFESVYSKLRDPSKRFIWIERMLEPEVADRIRAMDLRGVSLVKEWRRVYPNESILAPTLGFLGIDGQALEGVELQYDTSLRGNMKKVVVRRDARGRPLMADGLLFQQNPDGNDLALTVDSEIQYMLESELSSAVGEFEADSAVGVVLDAQTSAIRAIATVPTFDANKGVKTNFETRRNRAVTDSFEPGSTMKTFVVASALHDGKLHANSKYFCEYGTYKVADRVIHDADGEKFGWLSVGEILAHSSNIGATKIAFQVGEETLRRGLLDFGFGTRLGVDLPGEAHGLVQALPWRSHLLSNISFGQGISATPLQIANAYAAIANGGVLNQPYIVQSTRDSETGTVTDNKPHEIRRVLSPDEAAQMRIMLSEVTATGGTGVSAKVNGFIVAGKTGTAQMADLQHGGYMKGAYVSSFAGFIPSSDPRFVIYVAVDHPRKAYYGAQVAAPIFAKIASYAVRKEGIAPMLLSQRNMVSKKGPVRMPAAPATNDLTLATDVESTQDSKTAEFVPELNKLTLREVLRKINGRDIKLKIVGQGAVSETWPRAGETVPADRQVTVFLK